MYLCKIRKSSLAVYRLTFLTTGAPIVLNKFNVMPTKSSLNRIHPHLQKTKEGKKEKE